MKLHGIFLASLLAIGVLTNSPLNTFDKPKTDWVAKALLEQRTDYRAVHRATRSKIENYKGARNLEQDELHELLKLVGFKGEGLRSAWALAMRESNGRPRAHNDNPKTGDNSYGIFQINMIGDLGVARMDKFNLERYSDLFDPVRNAQITFHMSKGGKDWGSWNIGANAYNGEKNSSSYYRWYADYPY